MRSLLCRKDSYEFGKTKKILSWQRDISISWNAFRSEPTRWSSSFDPKYLSDPSKFDDPRTPEGPTSRTSRDILVTSKYSKPPSKSTKKKQQQKQFYQLYIDKPIAMQMSFAFVLTQRLKWIVILLKY